MDPQLLFAGGWPWTWQMSVSQLVPEHLLGVVGMRAATLANRRRIASAPRLTPAAV
jgi:hypothetical protein